MAKSKVCHNIAESNYKFTSDNITFLFSSPSYLDKFISKRISNREDLTYKLTGRMKISCDCVEYADIMLYSTIEKRGFFIVFKGKVIRCLEDLKLDIEIKTKSL